MVLIPSFSVRLILALVLYALGLLAFARLVSFLWVIAPHSPRTIAYPEPAFFHMFLLKC